ncbi:hypothetical protein [Hydrocarboniphaga sp.]|uniref:hypothetical protein n=1 Tax=Hydrocarboniphaga sp. TaxID=2033016 RepID=UPI003D11629E
MRAERRGAGVSGTLAVSRVMAEPKPADWTCALEHPAPAVLLQQGELLRFEGWVLSRRKPVTAVRVLRECDDYEIGQLQIGLERDGVAKAHPKIKHAASCGFGGHLPVTEEGSYRIECATAGQRWQPLFSFSLRDPARRPTQLMFMHIAKTAGNSVNRFLSDNAGAAHCVLHLEVDPRWRSSIGRAQIAAMPVISGHITFPAFKRRLDAANYIKVTLLRTPLDHLISHLEFIRYLADPSQRQRLTGHAPTIQAFAAKLAATDFSSGEAVRGLVDQLLPEELMLVDNLQVRYLSAVAPGARVQRAALNDARHALNEFDHVGLTEMIGDFLGGIAQRMGWPPPRYIPEENRNPGRGSIDPGIPEVRAALQPLIEFDQLLYRYARKVFIEGNERTSRRAGKGKRERGAAEAAAVVGKQRKTKSKKVGSA